MLEIEGLSVRYGAQTAVSQVSLTVSPGQIVALVGANGAGKTSTLSAVSGLVRPAAGRVLLDGRDVTGVPAHRIVRKGVSQVPEGRRMIAPLTVEENLLLGGYARRRDARGLAASMRQVYEIFPILDEKRAVPSGVLSGGQQQMLAFGRAMMAAPRVMLLDEPTMGLAPAVVGTILDAVEQMRSLGLMVLMVEQNGAAVLDVADHVCLLERGVVVGQGRTTDLAGGAVMRALLGLSDEADAMAATPRGAQPPTWEGPQ